MCIVHEESSPDRAHFEFIFKVLNPEDQSLIIRLTCSAPAKRSRCRWVTNKKGLASSPIQTSLTLPGELARTPFPPRYPPCCQWTCLGPLSHPDFPYPSRRFSQGPFLTQISFMLSMGLPGTPLPPRSPLPFQNTDCLACFVSWAICYPAWYHSLLMTVLPTSLSPEEDLLDTNSLLVW